MPPWSKGKARVEWRNPKYYLTPTAIFALPRVSILYCFNPSGKRTYLLY